jgi:hypothetical protein
MVRSLDASAARARLDQLLARVPLRGFRGRQIPLQHFPPRSLVIERREQAGFLTRVHLSAIGRNRQVMQRGRG